MTHWKGTRVQITIYKHWNDDHIIYQRFLDTDTMTDLFEVYPPSEYVYEIEKIDSDEVL